MPAHLFFPHPSRDSRLARAAGVGVALVFVAIAAPAAAQSEPALRSFFEGKRVTLKIDMPATSSGVDVTPAASRPLDYQRYGDRLKRNGTSIRTASSAIVTLVKVKKDLIEFQLDGGGFGTFGDDTSSSVDMPLVEKSNREKDLERRVKTETDSVRRRALQRELDDVRNARERENRRIQSEKALAEDHKRVRIAEQRLNGGSRFNLRYPGGVPASIRPEDVVIALAEYLDFASSIPSAPTAPAVQSDAMPKKGMSRTDAERLFGKPTATANRVEGGITVTTLIFIRGEQRISAEFVEDVLVRYTISSK